MTVRYSLEPLAAAVGVSMATLLARAGAAGGQWHRYRTEGVLDKTADRYAVRFGFHPYEIWPDFGLPRCECCGGPFTRDRRTQRYCTSTCRHRASKRRVRATPEGRAKNLEMRRRYYQENGDYERARQRRYDRSRAIENASNRGQTTDNAATSAQGRSSSPSAVGGGPRGARLEPENCHADVRTIGTEEAA